MPVQHMHSIVWVTAHIHGVMVAAVGSWVAMCWNANSGMGHSKGGEGTAQWGMGFAGGLPLSGSLGLPRLPSSTQAYSVWWWQAQVG